MPRFQICGEGAVLRAAFGRKTPPFPPEAEKGLRHPLGVPCLLRFRSVCDPALALRCQVMEFTNMESVAHLPSVTAEAFPWLTAGQRLKTTVWTIAF